MVSFLVVHSPYDTKIAARIGECNGLRMHFGPTNVAVWRLGVGIELGEGGRAYELATRTPLDMAALNSQERSAALHFDLARALVQDGPNVPILFAAREVGISGSSP